MPTAKPRIQVTLTTAQYELLRSLARLQHRSMSAIVAELWESIHPVLERVAVVLQAAVRAQDSAKEGLRKSLDKGERELQPHVAAALGQLDLLAVEFEAAAGPVADAGPRSVAAAAHAPTPVLVTRGSGLKKRGGRTSRSPAPRNPVRASKRTKLAKRRSKR